MFNWRIVIVGSFIVFAVIYLYWVANLDAQPVQDTTSIQRFFSGDDVRIAELGNRDYLKFEAGIWCTSHNVPKEEFDAKVKQLVGAYMRTTVKIDLSEPPVAEPADSK